MESPLCGNEPYIFSIWLLKAALSSEISYEIKLFSLDEKGIANLFTFAPAKRGNIKYSSIQDQKIYLQKQITQKSKLGLEVASLLYQLHSSIEDIPDELFLEVRGPKEKSPIITYGCIIFPVDEYL